MFASTSFAMVSFSATSFEIGEMRGGEAGEGKRKGIIRGDMSVRAVAKGL
jgi:hypothetical protein